jgi:glycerol uptake facilitator-like aquaporin
MATKKAASTKKATAKKPAAAKTTVRTVRAEAKPETTPVVRTAVASNKSGSKLPSNIVNLVLAELVGTFVLTLVALATFTDSGALYVGLALAVLVFAVGAVSGTHINPAVTFGLWATRKLKSILVPFYWGAQLLGAMLALIVTNWVSDSSTNLSFNHFWNFNWGIFACELVGAAVFLFGLTAVLSRRELTAGVRAIGAGLTLTIGLVAGGSLLSTLKSQDVAAYQKQSQTSQTDKSAKTPSVPYSAYVKGITANPAIALAVSNHSDSELGVSTTDTTTYSYFTSSVILGTLIGAALGGNLYLLIAGRNKND